MRGVLVASTLVLTAALTVGCQPPAGEMEPDRTEQEVEADFDALRADWQSMANADDAAGVAALYTADAVFIEVSGEVYSGRDAIAGYLEESFPQASDLTIETTDLMTHGDVVAGYGTFSQTVAGPEGEMSMSGMWMTVAAYQPDGNPRIVLHQSMLPAELPEPEQAEDTAEM